MGDWKSVLNGDPTGWLLEEDNPSVRYFSLRDILERPEGDADVRAAKRAIMESGVIPAILKEQGKDGSWGDARNFYTAKYRGTVWQLIVLAELGADGNDERIRRACEALLDYSQDLESGGFSIAHGAKTGGGRHSDVVPCLTGNMAWSLIRLGYLEDPRLLRAVKWIATYQRFDDGIDEAPHGWPYDRYEMCWGKHSCHMGVVKALKALAEIPVNRRSGEVGRAIEKGAEYLLIHHIFKRSHDLGRVSKPGWKKFGFPRMYQTDVLEILGILTRLGYRDERMREAIDLVISKQDGGGRWKLEDTFNGRSLVDIEEKGKPSKWVTLKALGVLKRYYGSTR
ncbi:MAG TPA: nitrogen fixation protein NifH [Methanocella sp.]|nr:nitrogen fixation protein NifH [Methanocella sp.]